MKLSFPIAVSISFLVLLMLGLEAVSMMYVSYRQFKFELLEEVISDQVEVSLQMQANLEYLIEKNDLNQIQAVVSELGSNPNLDIAVLVDSENQVLAGNKLKFKGLLLNDLNLKIERKASQKLAAEAKKMLGLKQYVATDKSKVILFQPVIMGASERSIKPDKIGLLIIQFDLRWIDKEVLRSLLGWQLPMFGIMGVLTVLFGVYLYFAYIQRIKNISKVAMSVTNGNSKLRIDDQREDEIAYLGSFFNKMLDAVQKNKDEMQQALGDISAREQNLEITLQSIGDAVIATDYQGKITRMNKVAERLTGWDMVSASERPLYEVFNIIDSKSREAVLNPVTKVIETGEIVELCNSTVLLSRTGAEYHISDSASPIKDDQGVIHGAILVFQDVTQEYKTREEIRINEQRLKLAMEGASDGFWDWSLDDGAVYFSPRWKEMLGFSKNDITGNITDWKDLIHPDDSEAVLKSLDDHIQGRKPFFEEEHRVRRRDGNWIWILSRGRVVDRAEDGRPLRVAGTTSDITEKVSAEEEQRKRVARMKQYQMALMDWAKVDYIDYIEAIYKVVELTAKTLGVERASVWLFSNELETLVCEGLYVSTEKRHYRRQALDSVRAKEYLSQFHETNVLIIDEINDNPVSVAIETDSTQNTGVKSSLNVPVHLHGDVIGVVCCEDNKKETSWSIEDQDFMISIANMISLSLEIEDRKQAETALRRHEQELSLILDNMVDSVITIDENNDVISFNHAAELMFGYSQDEIIGQSVNVLMPEPYRSHHDRYVKQYIETGEAKVIGFGRELTGLRKSGEEFPMLLSINQLPANEYGIHRFIASCLDISEQKKRDEQIRRAQKMDALGKLTGGIAHDYNNMLGVIIGYAELLANALQNNSELSRYVESIQRAGERGKNLTQNLMAFSRNKSSVARQLNINDILKRDEDMLSKTLTAMIELKFSMEPSLWPVYVDENDLEDAILNLSINAMHAMPGGGVLAVKTENIDAAECDARKIGLDSGDYVALEFMDNGIGIDNSTQDKIFDPFFTTKGDSGTGLGLSQVYGLVQRAKGTVQVFSRVGEGTTLTLYFPRYKTQEVIDKDTMQALSSGLEGDALVLVVDDEPALLNLAEVILKSYGYRVLLAASAKQAMEVLEQEPVSLVVSDIIMPEIDGYRLAGMIRENFPHVKIQLVSGYSDTAYVENVDYELQRNIIYKPYSSGQLAKRIRALLDSSSE